MLLTLLILCPLVAAIASFLTRKTKLLELFAGLATSVEFVIGTLIGLSVAQTGSYKLGAYFEVDALGAIILFTIITMGLAASLYSIGYLREELKKGLIGTGRTRQYYLLVNLFLFAMLVATTTTSPIVMWIAIEITTLSTAFLISFYNKPKALEAAWKYLIINSVGLLLGFFGTLLFFTAMKEGVSYITWQSLIENAANLNPLIGKIAFVFMFVGYGTKVGFVPMHTWKPDAYSKAPSPLGALFSGPLLCVAYLAILRYKLIADAALGKPFTQSIFVFFGIATLIITALIIFTQKNYKRLFAYSSVEHAGIMALGFGFGGIGTFAAILHMIYHSLAKPIAFLSAGNILLKYDSAKIQKVKGALSVLPLTGVMIIIGFLAVTGVPPFGLFITEFNILSAGIGRYPYITAAALLSLAIIFAGFLGHISQMVFGEAPEEIKKGESNYWTTVPPLALIAILLFLSFYLPAPLLSLINSAAALIK